jgi:hypothetical protein
MGVGGRLPSSFSGPRLGDSGPSSSSSSASDVASFVGVVGDTGLAFLFDLFFFAECPVVDGSGVGKLGVVVSIGEGIGFL